MVDGLTILNMNAEYAMNRSRTVLVPSKAKLRSISDRRMPMAWATPASPATAAA